MTEHNSNKNVQLDDRNKQMDDRKRQMRIASLIQTMIIYDHGDPMRIHHFLKVLEFSRTIGILECVSEDTQYILETAAVVHEIGIHVCEDRYGNSNGKLQEQEGPAIAKTMLAELGYEDEVIERVCYLVGHHHTYTDIDGMDYQILVEADFLVNLYEDDVTDEGKSQALQRIFKTKTGYEMLRQIYDISE